MNEFVKLQLQEIPRLPYKMAPKFFKDYWDQDYWYLTKERRKFKRVVIPVQKIQYVLRVYCKLSYPRIAQIFNRCHTTPLINTRRKAADNAFVVQTHKEILEFLNAQQL